MNMKNTNSIFSAMDNVRYLVAKHLIYANNSSLPIIGTAIIYSIPPSPATRVGLLISFYLTQFYLAEGNMIFSMISRNVAGQTKKSTTLAMTFIAWAAGNMAAPQVRFISCPRTTAVLLTLIRFSKVVMLLDIRKVLSHTSVCMCYSTLLSSSHAL